MSFFGFDPTAKPGSRPDDGKPQNLQNFEEFGPNGEEEDDALNEETFGTSANDIGTDFDFSSGFNQQASNADRKRAALAPGLKPAPIASKPAISYAQAANESTDESSLKPMASLWTDDKDTSKKPQQQSSNDEKVYSLEEIEAKMRAQPPPPQVPTQPQMMPPQQMLPPGMNPFMMPYQAQQQLLASAVASGRYPDIPTAARAMAQMMMAQFPGMPGVPPMQPPMPMQPMQGQPGQGQFMMQPGQPMPQGKNQQPQQVQPQQVQTQPQQPQQSQQVQPQPVKQSQPRSVQPQSQQAHHQHQPVSSTSQKSSAAPAQKPRRILTRPQSSGRQMSQNAFPSIDSVADGSAGNNADVSGESSYPSPAPSPSGSRRERKPNRGLQQESRGRNYVGGNNYRGRHFYNQQQRQFQHQRQIDAMTPEEKKIYFHRQEKVSRITRASGFMNPKDKDYVTRFQLARIVTDDPYNEDFYCQVYKVLNSSVEENSMNSLAKKYLEESGHRLGGHSKRADIALQRMQQQVSKAVSVAKERGQRTGILSKEGALGSVSFGTNKRPRQLLVVNSGESQTGKNNAPRSLKLSKSSRAFRLSVIESIYSEVLKLESREREGQDISDEDLWKAINMSEQIASQGENVHPVVSVLSFNKMMKVFNRVFHLLSDEHKAQVIEIIFKNMQSLDVVLKGSYTSYADKKYEIPKDVRESIQHFQVTIMKTMVLYISNLNFSDVLHYMDVIVNNNNVLFLSTTKVGISLMTVLISRLELIKQEFAKTLNPQELSEWDTIYDKFFKSFEGQLPSVFPPYFSLDAERRVENSESKEDDSYIWQFLASLSLAGKLSHQRIIVDEIRDEIFGVMNNAKELKASGDDTASSKALGNLNLFLNVMGLNANENDITELSQ